MLDTHAALEFARRFQYAIVVSQFNGEVTERLLKGAEARFDALSVPLSSRSIFRVPGAVEVPLVAQACARTERFDAIIALSAVIRGETGHYDFVCEQISAGCQRVALDYHLPVIFGVLTTEDTQQALERSGGHHGNKGADTVDAAVSMILTLDKIATGYE